MVFDNLKVITNIFTCIKSQFQCGRYAEAMEYNYRYHSAEKYNFNIM